jgi:hypothetical protein
MSCRIHKGGCSQELVCLSILSVNQFLAAGQNIRKPVEKNLVEFVRTPLNVQRGCSSHSVPSRFDLMQDSVHSLL